MRALRFLLAFAVAAGTFYSLNALAIHHGYPDRLDFTNKNYRHEDCHSERRATFKHPKRSVALPLATDTLNKTNR